MKRSKEQMNSKIDANFKNQFERTQKLVHILKIIKKE